MKISRSEFGGGLIESALVCLPFCAILIATIGIVQLFNSMGMVTLDVVATNMESIARVNKYGTASPGFTSTNQLFDMHPNPTYKSQAISNYSGEKLGDPIRGAIANSAAGVAWLTHGNPFGIPTGNVPYNTEGVRFIKILDSTVAPEVADNAIVVMEYQPTIFRLTGTKGIVSAAMLNPLVPSTAEIVNTFSHVTPGDVGSIVPPGGHGSGDDLFDYDSKKMKFKMK